MVHALLHLSGFANTVWGFILRSKPQTVQGSSVELVYYFKVLEAERRVTLFCLLFQEHGHRLRHLKLLWVSSRSGRGAASALLVLGVRSERRLVSPADGNVSNARVHWVMVSRKFIANSSLEGKNSCVQHLLESNPRADFKATSDFRPTFWHQFLQASISWFWLVLLCLH